MGVVIICSFLPLILSNFLPANHGAAVFADVTSANVVGYQEIGSNASGFTMLAPTFLGVGNTEGCTLKDLRVTGYEGECKGKFVLQLLTSTGGDDGTYYWVDKSGKTAGWYASALGSAIPGGPESINIAAGRGMWCKGVGMKLVPAGEVCKALTEFDTNESGFTATGNSSPVDITLDKLTVTGYEGECKGKFVLQLLTSTGGDDGTYYWVDKSGKTAGWYASALGSAIPGGPESVTITAGRGLWCKGVGMTLKIPSAIK